ncbi:sulfotransferase [bacterium]|nr:sulfotransferase [bacterium]
MANDKRLVFILGTPRSGTSWAVKTFDLLPTVCALFEPDVPRRYDSPWREQISSYWSAEPFVITPDTATAEAQQLAKPVFQHLDHVIEQEAKREHDTVVIKIPRLEKMPLLLDHYRPDFVYFMHRNPFAILNSNERFGMLKRIKSTINLEFDQMQRHAPEFGINLDFARAQTLPQKHALITHVRHQLAPTLLQPYSNRIVEYEDLCFDSADRYRELFTEAGLGWSETVGEEIRKRGQPAEVGASFHSVQRVSEERAHGWRNELSPEIVDSVAAMFADLGIEDNTPPLTPEERSRASAFHATRTKRLKQERVLKSLHHVRLRLTGKR